jgi:hypothetical protein
MASTTHTTTPLTGKAALRRKAYQRAGIKIAEPVDRIYQGIRCIYNRELVNRAK